MKKGKKWCRGHGGVLLISFLPIFVILDSYSMKDHYSRGVTTCSELDPIISIIKHWNTPAVLLRIQTGEIISWIEFLYSQMTLACVKLTKKLASTLFIFIDLKTSQTNRENYLDMLMMVHHNHIIESRSGKISKLKENEKITIK